MKIDDLKIDRDDVASFSECIKIFTKASDTGKVGIFDIANLYVSITTMAAKAGLDKEVLDELIRDIYKAHEAQDEAEQTES